MAALHRRRLLTLLGLGGAASASPAAAQAPRRNAGAVRFLHGVASGDPGPTSVIFWTRITPEDPAGGDIDARLEVAEDEGFRRIVRTSTGLRARASRDFTLKHDLDGQGLKPGTDYWYRFTANGVVSPVGRTRTLPAAGATAPVTLAVCSCALHPGGLFNAYAAVAQQPKLDAVVHLGDYIYEYGAAPGDYGMAVGGKIGRIPEPPKEIVTLADYRLRHAQYKADPDLQAAHARAPWIVVWDDHEVANDGFLGGAQNHQVESEGDFNVRKAAALQAYYEWMPIREPAPGRPREAIQRAFRFGAVADLLMVETRLHARTEQLSYDADLPVVGGRPDVAAFRAKLDDPKRQLLGPDGEAWLAAELKRSVNAGVAWQVLGNQVIMARVGTPDLKRGLGEPVFAAAVQAATGNTRKRLEGSAALASLGVPFNLDSWDGYPAARERLYGLLAAAKARPIVLAGDSHAAWANELKDKAGQLRAVEFGATAITSPGYGDLFPGVDLGAVVAAQNDEVAWTDQGAKGFVLLTLTPDAARAEMVAVSTVLAKPFDTRVLKTATARRTPTGVSALELT